MSLPSLPGEDPGAPNIRNQLLETNPAMLRGLDYESLQWMLLGCWLSRTGTPPQARHGMVEAPSLIKRSSVPRGKALHEEAP